MKNTWPKIFVLTEDGRFYCEYLNFMRPSVIELSFDFHTFRADGFLWRDYQPIQEIDEETAKSRVLVHQKNWVGRYLLSLEEQGN